MCIRIRRYGKWCDTALGQNVLYIFISIIMSYHHLQWTKNIQITLLWYATCANNVFFFQLIFFMMNRMQLGNSFNTVTKFIHSHHVSHSIWAKLWLRDKTSRTEQPVFEWKQWTHKRRNGRQNNWLWAHMEFCELTVAFGWFFFSSPFSSIWLIAIPPQVAVLCQNSRLSDCIYHIAKWQ